jgi:exodeoxyribonuclease-3
MWWREMRLLLFFLLRMVLFRLDWRTKTWDTMFHQHLAKLRQTKPFILTGDLNVCHLDLDIYAPAKYKNKVAGFCDAERASFSALLATGCVDVFRHFYPTEKDWSHTYWGFRGNPNGLVANRCVYFCFQ